MNSFPVNSFVRVVDANRGSYAEDGSIGIVCEGSDEYITRVFLIRGPYWKANDPLMIELHSMRSGRYIRTSCLEAANIQLTEHERDNLKTWWNAHGFEIQ